MCRSLGHGGILGRRFVYRNAGYAQRYSSVPPEVAGSDLEIGGGEAATASLLRVPPCRMWDSCPLGCGGGGPVPRGRRGWGLLVVVAVGDVRLHRRLTSAWLKSATVDEPGYLPALSLRVGIDYRRLLFCI